jgi:hypothetical protein
VTAKTSDGKEVFKDERIFMPIPALMGRSETMGRGPYDKSGLVRDTSLPPHKTTTEKFDVNLFNVTEKDGKKVYEAVANDFVVDIELWYLPYGKKDDPGNSQLWNKFSKTISLSRTIQ